MLQVFLFHMEGVVLRCEMAAFRVIRLPLGVIALINIGNL
jgi:hypothetical protein